MGKKGKKGPVALLCSEPIRDRMGGIGIRYVEFARHLDEAGFAVLLVSPGDPAALPANIPQGVGFRCFEGGRLAETIGDCDCAVAQGQIANSLVTECPDLPAVIDLYDPCLVENLHYTETLGYDPYRNDHASWVLQLSRGDFFLCSSEEQRLYYLGFLTALGRINPKLVKDDPDLTNLIAPVPFGVPEIVPPYQPYLPPPRAGEKRLLFGGLYDWYDPWTLIDALEMDDFSPWSLIIMKNPNPETTPQRLFLEVQRRAEKTLDARNRIEFHDWAPAERRFDLLRDVSALVAPHQTNIETRLSLRTRFLEALAVGCPVVTSEGGALSRLLREEKAGWVAPAGDAGGLAVILRDLFNRLDKPAETANGRRLAAKFSWEKVLDPLLQFCTKPSVDRTKFEFACTLETKVPPDPLLFRLRQRWHRVTGGGGEKNG